MALNYGNDFPLRRLLWKLSPIKSHWKILFFFCVDTFFECQRGKHFFESWGDMMAQNVECEECLYVILLILTKIFYIKIKTQIWFKYILNKLFWNPEIINIIIYFYRLFYEIENTIQDIRIAWKIKKYIFWNLLSWNYILQQLIISIIYDP